MHSVVNFGGFNFMNDKSLAKQSPELQLAKYYVVILDGF